MNKRSLATTIFFALCALYSLYRTFHEGFAFQPFSFFCIFSALVVMFARHLRD